MHHGSARESKYTHSYQYLNVQNLLMIGDQLFTVRV